MPKEKSTYKNIITLPDPRLRERSERVHVVTDEIREIIQNMIDATLDWEKSRPHEVATALSAVQIGELKRIVILREDFDDKSNKNFIVLINPEIVKFEGNITSDSEGCLSVQDIYADVPRHEKIRVKAMDINGNEVHFKVKDPFIARILQHEIDHTNGIPFIDRVVDKKSFAILDENGELQSVPYEKVKKMGILKDDN